ncbi:helix-turn-helix domain-containing protein [Sphingobacterium lactis]
MNQETEMRILKALVDWESQKFFLNPACSITSTSKEIGCNTKYLSFVVNKNKNMDFPNYVNNLRLEYLNQYLREVEEARNFKLTYLAAISGFSSYGKFAKCIKDRTGYSPTQFIVFFDHKTA